MQHFQLIDRGFPHTAMDDGNGKKVLVAKRRKCLTSGEKNILLQKFYQIPQPCTQKQAASLLDISQATLSRLIGNKFAKKIGGNDVQKETDECARKKNEKEVTCDVPRERKRMTTEEKLDLLKKYDRLLPCTQLTAASMLNVPQSTLSYLLKVRNELIENSDREQRCGGVVTESNSNIALTSSEHTAPIARRPPRKRRAPKRFDFDTLEEVLETGEEENLNSKQKIHVLHSKKEQSEIEVKETGEIAAQTLDRRHRMRSLPEKIKIFRLFDRMQPCSHDKARAALKISSSTLSGLIANRKAIEEEFRKQLTDNLQVLEKYDALESNQLPLAHLICGLPKSKLDCILENREFWEVENHEDVSVGQKITPVTDAQHVGKELLVWYRANYTQQVTWMQLMNKAQELVKSLGSSFVPSDAWMSKWTRKASRLLTKPVPSTPPATARVDCLFETSTVLPALKDYHPDNIFNLDETGLYYRARPGFVPEKCDWVTVLFTCNMSGTEKKRLTVVGKTEASLVSGLSMSLDYMHSSDSRMSQEILSNLLKEWNMQLRANDRSIALILDDCSMHMNIDVELDRIKLFFVSNNSPSPSQPLNRGIIGYTKTRFRKKLLNISKIVLLDSLYMLADAWDEVPEKVIINAFAELVFPNSSHPVPDEEPNEDIARLNELDEDLLPTASDDDVRECMEDVLTTEECMIDHVEGVVDPSEEQTETPAANDQRTPPNSGGLDSELRNVLDSPGHPFTSKSSEISKVSEAFENILGESLCKELGLSKIMEKEPPGSAEVHVALGVIKRFLRMNGGTLEDLTDFTQLELKVLSKM